MIEAVPGPTFQVVDGLSRASIVSLWSINGLIKTAIN